MNKYSNVLLQFVVGELGAQFGHILTNATERTAEKRPRRRIPNASNERVARGIGAGRDGRSGVERGQRG